jgi:RHS repeat-associated protein
MSRYFLPLTAFLVAGILAMLSGPSLGFVSRAMMQTTGKRYYCKRCNLKTHREETRESDTDLSGQTDPGFTPWKCWSAFPVNYVTGANEYATVDLQTLGLSGFSLDRMYLQDPGDSDGGLGPCWRFGWFYRAEQSGTNVTVIAGNDPITSFTDNLDGTYSSDFDYVDRLTADVVNHLLVLTDAKGKVWKFFDFSASWNPARRGRLKEFADRGGNLTTTIYGTSGVSLDQLLEVQQTDPNPNLLHRFTFAYYLSGASVGRLSSVTYAQTNTGVTTTVRIANYTYYASSGPNGPAGTLQRARVTDASGNPLDTWYYRYNAMGADGFVPLRYAVNPKSYDRLSAALGGDIAVDNATDLQLSTYADYYFQYDGLRRVIQEVVQGTGCGCGAAGGKGTFGFFYQTASHGQPDAPNVWRNKCTVTLPDGNLEIVYTSGAGQNLLEAYKDVTSGQQWLTYRVFNGDYGLAAMANPSAVTGFDETTAGLVSSANLPDAAGLWHLVNYYPTTNLPAGAVAKYVSSRQIRQGEIGAPVLQEVDTYTSRTGASATIYPVASRTLYRNTNGTGGQTTTYGYTWQGTTTEILQQSVTNPIVPVGQNGLGAATSAAAQLDAFGRTTWAMDEDGFIQATEYDTLTGAVTKQILDVNTATVPNEPTGWVTPPGGGLHLVYTFLVDVLGRTTKTTDPLGQISYTVYRDVQHETRVYPGWNSSTNKPTGPTQLVREDRARNYAESLLMSATPTVSAGVPIGTETISGLTALTRHNLDTGDRPVSTDTYFSFTGLTYTPDPMGTLGTHFYRASYGYDPRGRKDRVQDWTGTITRAVFDSRSRVTALWVGTDDTPTSGDWSPTNTAGTNLVKVSTSEYDSGGVGDGNLTKSSVLTGGFNSLDTTYQYDFRSRVARLRTPDRIYRVPTYDNLNQATQVDTYYDVDNNTVLDPTELRGRSETSYDERGLAYRAIVHNVFSTGAVGNHLTTNAWYNGRRARIKTKDPNGLLTKVQLDGVGRTSAVFMSYDDAETIYADAFNVTGDAVIDERVSAYDAASNLIQETRYARTSSASVPPGDLAAGWAVGNARRTFLATWYDLANRTTGAADYGDNGNVAFSRPVTAPAPNSSPNVLVTKYEYDAGGRLYRVTDNMVKVTQTTYDALSRATRVIVNFVDGTASQTELDTDKTTDYVFDSSGRLSQRIAYNPKGTGAGVQQQITKYAWGTIAVEAVPAVYRNDLLAAEIYPDSDDTYNPALPAGSQLANGADAAYDRLEYTYDLAGRRLTFKDQRQNLHTYDYKPQDFPGAGKLGNDVVTTLGPGTDGSVRRIYYEYDSLGRFQQTNSYSDTGFANLTSFQSFNYDGWGNPFQLIERHTPAASIYFFANFADGAGVPSGGEAKYVRLSSVVYQNGREVDYLYPSSGVGDKLSRVDAIANDSAGTLKFAQYTYLGQRSVVRVDHPGITGGLALDYGINAGSPAGWDRFGRLIDHKWGSTADPNKLDRFQHTYDNASQRLTSDRTYTGAPTNRDEQYAYDNLHRLVNMRRGTLSGGTISNTNSTLIHDWPAMETQGNWRSWRTSPGGKNNPTYSTQARSHNKANEIDVDDNDANAAGASITQTSGTGMDWIDPQYDKSGNLKNGPRPGAETAAASRLHLSFDAWNRLTKVQADSGGVPGATIVEYQYDGLHRRIVKLKPNGANWDRRDYFYNASWQVVEERELLNTPSKTTEATVPKYQWVWDLRYVDAPVLRDENKDGDGDCVDGTDERLYYLQDANFNVTALVTPAGAVAERYAYDPYGNAAVFTSAWVTQAPTVYNNEILFGGYRLNQETSLYLSRNRDYHPTLGRWLQRDPVGYAGGGSNLYEYAGSMPTVAVDPSGLKHCNLWITSVTVTLNNKTFGNPTPGQQNNSFSPSELTMAFTLAENPAHGDWECPGDPKDDKCCAITGWLGRIHPDQDGDWFIRDPNRGEPFSLSRGGNAEPLGGYSATYPQGKGLPCGTNQGMNNAFGGSRLSTTVPLQTLHTPKAGPYNLYTTFHQQATVGLFRWQPHAGTENTGGRYGYTPAGTNPNSSKTVTAFTLVAPWRGVLGDTCNLINGKIPIIQIENGALNFTMEYQDPFMPRFTAP